MDTAAVAWAEYEGNHGKYSVYLDPYFLLYTVLILRITMLACFLVSYKSLTSSLYLSSLYLRPLVLFYYLLFRVNSMLYKMSNQLLCAVQQNESYI